MGIFSRLSQLLKSNINDMISRAEDPEKMLNQVIIDMNEQLVLAKKQVAVSIADASRLEKQFQMETEKSTEWERKAMLAIRANNDELAKEALNRKNEHEKLASEFKGQWEKQHAAVEQLKTALHILDSKIGDAKRKKDLIIARKKRAEAQKSIHETMAGMTNNSAFETFDRLERKVDQLESEADAAAEMNQEFASDSLEHKFDQLQATAGADADLLALKQKMGLAPPPAPPAAVRVATTGKAPAAATTSDEDELAAALAENEASEKQQQKKEMGR